MSIELWRSKEQEIQGGFIMKEEVDGPGGIAICLLLMLMYSEMATAAQKRHVESGFARLVDCLPCRQVAYKATLGFFVPLISRFSTLLEFGVLQLNLM